MAKNYSKQEGKGSLIFIWILILLLAVGSFFVVKNYSDTHTDVMENTEIAQLIAEKSGKKLGALTAEDLAKVEVLSVSGQIDYAQLMSPNGSISISPDQELPYINYITLCLEGYEEAVANGDSTAAAENYSVSYEGSLEDIAADIDLFTGINTLELIDFSGSGASFDLATIDPAKYTNIKSMTLIGYDVDNFANIENFKNLTSLSVSAIGDSDLAYIKGLTALETLYVEGTEITDVSVVENLTALKDLTVTGTSIKNIPALDKLVNLETVDFTNNNLTDIAPLAALNAEKITNVSITGNAIEDFSPISHIAEDKIVKDEPAEEETTEEATEEVTEEATEETAEATTEEATEDATEATADEATEDAAEETVETATEEVAE